MLVVCPWAELLEWCSDGHPVVDALNAATEVWAAHDVGTSDRDYFDLISELWRDGETFCIVEHDIVIHPTALDELASCPHDWCGFPHEYMGTLTHSLGCVKFSADLIARNPDAMQRVGAMFDAHHEKRHWCRLDAWLQGCVLPGAGEVKHEHLPPVKHLGVGCSHGCTTNA